jgi:hypothetical protein
MGEIVRRFKEKGVEKSCLLLRHTFSTNGKADLDLTCANLICNGRHGHESGRAEAIDSLNWHGPIGHYNK